MTTVSSIRAAASDLVNHGVAYASQIASAASKYNLDPKLLAAVVAQETGGPDTNSGANIVGDGGHGHGIFQIDDRWHAFAQTRSAMNPSKNADYAAGMIRGLLDRYHGNMHEALSAYNAGDPRATGTTTQWQDGQTLGYADSVLRHYQRIAGTSSDARSEPVRTTAWQRNATSNISEFLNEAIAERASAIASINALNERTQNTSMVSKPHVTTTVNELYDNLIASDSDKES